MHLGRRLGAGGFTRVVAIKLPHEWVTEDPALIESLEREAFVASRLHHANVVSVLDVTEIDGRMAIIMEYVEGVALSSLLVDLVEAAAVLPELPPRPPPLRPIRSARIRSPGSAEW